jgi:hypothetical protein
MFRIVAALAVAAGASCHQLSAAAMQAQTPSATSDSDGGVGLRCGAGTAQVGSQCLPLTCGPGTVQVGNDCLVGETGLDPLIGSWSDPARGICDFFPNRMWNRGCISALPGSAEGWDRIGENRYVLQITSGACLAATTFSNDRNSVTISTRCGNQPDFALNLVRTGP